LAHAAARALGRERGIHRASRVWPALLIACSALTLSGLPRIAAAQAASPSSTPQAMPTTPSAGKALICVYRVTRVVGASTHDTLFVNGVLLGTLHSGEYACLEVAPGTVVISGAPDMYYGGVVTSSAAAAHDATKKESERTRLDVQEGKTCYFKWTSGALATGIKVTPVDEATGAKEMSKLHPTKPPEEKKAP
jgi:hypothetical protein